MIHGNSLGEKIGQGSNRTVYENLDDCTTVIKVQRPKTVKKNWILHNKIEWTRWNQYRNTIYEKLLCPCVCISDDGVYLVQRYAEVLAPGKHLKRSRAQWIELPNELRIYPDSRWYKNWGRLEGRYVLIDYGRENADRVGKRFHRTT